MDTIPLAPLHLSILGLFCFTLHCVCLSFDAAVIEDRSDSFLWRTHPGSSFISVQFPDGFLQEGVHSVGGYRLCRLHELWHVLAPSGVRGLSSRFRRLYVLIRRRAVRQAITSDCRHTGLWFHFLGKNHYACGLAGRSVVTKRFLW